MSAAAPSGDLSNQSVEVVPVDAVLAAENELPEEHRVTCRQMLQQASNQIVRRCMTQARWRTYDRAQEEWARQMLRIMQGSSYR